MPVLWDGDVSPIGSVSPFVNVEALDADNDGHIDGITSLGLSRIIDVDASQTDPEGDSGGLPWDANRIWAQWDYNAALQVGIKNAGSLHLSAGGHLRMTDLVIGEEANAIGYLQLTGSNGTNDATFNNDRDLIPYEVLKAHDLAVGSAKSLDEIVYDDIGADVSDLVSGTVAWERIPAGGYNGWVGKEGYGELDLNLAARVELRHQLLVGGYYLTNNDDTSDWVDGRGGLVAIGPGCTLLSRGRLAADTPRVGSTPESDPTGIPGRIGSSGIVKMTGGNLLSIVGLINGGHIEIETTSEPASLGAGQWADPVERGTIINRGLITVRSGSTLNVAAPMVNEGIIHLESGAKLATQDYSVSGGVIEYDKCGTASHVNLGDGWKSTKKNEQFAS